MDAVEQIVGDPDPGEVVHPLITEPFARGFVTVAVLDRRTRTQPPRAQDDAGQIAFARQLFLCIVLLLLFSEIVLEGIDGGGGIANEAADG